MTLTLSDTVSPAQPPTDGVRELLAFVAVTAAAYVCGALLFILLFAVPGAGATRPARRGELVTLWNRFVASVLEQNDALQSLDASLQAMHPDRALDARRLELYTRAVVESERQTTLLKAMRRAEFGKAGEESEGNRALAGAEARAGATSVAFVTNSP